MRFDIIFCMDIQKRKIDGRIVLFIIISVLTLVIVLSGVLFSSRKFLAYCYNSYDTDLDKSISAFVENEEKNKNIFVISENKLISMLEDEFENIDVINVERIFPDTVKINYVKIKEYAYVTIGSMNYYVSNTGRILSVDAGSVQKEGLSIRLLSEEQSVGQNVGEYLYEQDGNTVKYLRSITDLLERMGFVVAENFVKEINLNLLQSDVLRIETRAGASIEIFFPDVDFETKFRSVISVFNSTNDEKRSSGVWKVANNNVVTYDND